MMERTEKTAAPNQQVHQMFNAIAPRYDLLNRLLSGGRDRYWRRRTVARLAPQPGEHFLDIATGTADVALEIVRQSNTREVQVVGMDFSEPMLELARQKIDSRDQAGMIELQTGSAEHLPFADHTFDGTTTAFGVRNFSDLDRSLREMVRVLKPGGRSVILEFAMPRHPALNFLYTFYFETLLPRVGRLVSRHPSAYTYLPESVAAFPVREDFKSRMEQAGFDDVTYRELTFGIVILYTGIRRL